MLTPKQNSIYHELKHRLDEMKPGDRVPSVRSLMKQYGASQISVDKALQALRDEFDLVSRVGDGTYLEVLPGTEQAPSNIHYITHNFPSSFLHEVSRKLEAEARRQGFTFSVDTFSVDTFAWNSFPKSIRVPNHTRAVFAYLPATITNDVLLALLGVNVPVVLMSAAAESLALHCVGTDNEFGGALVANHLIGLGHRELAMVLAEPSDKPTIMARRRGFERQALLAGLPAPRIINCQTRSGEHPAQKAYETLSHMFGEQRPDFTGLFVDSDNGALGVYKACHEADLLIPNEISVVGFDDVPEAALLRPSLTTIRQDLDEWARQSVNIAKGVPHNEPPRQISIIPELIIRESSGNIHHNQTRCEVTT